MRSEAGEIVRLASQGKGGLPLEFDWRGIRHRIQAIDHYHMVTERSWDRVEKQRHFYLRTTRGLRCLLSQDVSREIWRLRPLHKHQGGA